MKDTYSIGNFVDNVKANGLVSALKTDAIETVKQNVSPAVLFKVGMVVDQALYKDKVVGYQVIEPESTSGPSSDGTYFVTEARTAPVIERVPFWK